MQVWPSKTLLQKTRGALLEKCLSTIGSVGCGTFFGGVSEVFGIAFGGFFERKCAEDN